MGRYPNVSFKYIVNDSEFRNLMLILFYRMKSHLNTNIISNNRSYTYTTDIGYNNTSFFYYDRIYIKINVDSDLKLNSSTILFNYDDSNNIFTHMELVINLIELDYNILVELIKVEMLKVKKIYIENKTKNELELIGKIRSGSNRLNNIVDDIISHDKIIILDDILSSINRLGNYELNILIKYTSIRYNKRIINLFDFVKFISERITSENNSIKSQNDFINYGSLSMKNYEFNLDF